MANDDYNFGENIELDYDTIMEILDNEYKNENPERRKKTDWLTRLPVALSSLSIVILLTVWFIIDRAAPQRYHAFLSLFSEYTHTNTSWSRFPLSVALVLLIASIVLCVIAFVSNKRRMRRKTDKYRVSVFVAGGITAIALIAFLLYFIPRNLI